jgi:hypothetical protein
MWTEPDRDNRTEQLTEVACRERLVSTGDRKPDLLKNPFQSAFVSTGVASDAEPAIIQVSGAA